MKSAPFALVPLVLSLGACSSSHQSRPPAESVPVQPDRPADSESSPAVPSIPFAGTEWRLVEVGGKAAQPGFRERVASVTFAPEGGGVHGSGGINSFFGPYALDGDKLRIENLGMTRMAGPPELMDQESAFVAALHAARAWKIRGDTLELADETGTMLARLRAAP